MKKLLMIGGAVLLTVAACADPVSQAAPKTGDASVVAFDTSANQQHITSAKVDSIAAELPAAVRESGTLVVGNGSAGGGLPPLGFTADDNKTPIGVEIDIAYLVASVLGLKAEIQTTSWENLFLGLDSGKYQVGISNIGGGSTADQAAEGDFLAKDDRYGRTREFIQILKQAWTSNERFDFNGSFYRFEQFLADIKPLQQPRPRISFGGSSAAAYAVGAAEADTVAAALLDYYDLGVRIFSARGCDIYDDAIDFGRYVIPLVRSEVAHREQPTRKDLAS